MRCATLLPTYTCSNATGTTCTKVTVTTLAVQVRTACVTGDMVLLDNTDYTTLTNNVTSAGTKADSATAAVVQGVTMKPIEATADDYQAIATIFAAVLTAAAVVWGVKQLFLVLRNPAEF